MVKDQNADQFAYRKKTGGKIMKEFSTRKRKIKKKQLGDNATIPLHH